MVICWLEESHSDPIFGSSSYQFVPRSMSAHEAATLPSGGKGRYDVQQASNRQHFIKASQQQKVSSTSRSRSLWRIGVKGHYEVQQIMEKQEVCRSRSFEVVGR